MSTVSSDTQDNILQVTSCKMGEQGHRTPFPIPVNRYEHLGREDGYKPRNAAGKTPNPLTLLQAHWKPGAPARRAETELSQSVGHFRSCARTPSPRGSTPRPSPPPSTPRPRLQRPSVRPCPVWASETEKGKELRDATPLPAGNSAMGGLARAQKPPSAPVAGIPPRGHMTTPS